MPPTAGSYCCTSCGLVYPVVGSLEDTFCPGCGAPRDEQELVTCALCSMPMVPHDGPGYFGHADPRGECAGDSPTPVMGMYTGHGRICQVNSGGGEIRRRVDSRHPTTFILLDGRMFITSAGPLHGTRLIAVHGKTRRPKRRKG